MNARLAAHFAALAAGLAIVASAVLHLRGVGGTFLSDDFGHLHVIAHTDRAGELARWTLSRFFEPPDSGNFAYRPLTVVSWVTDWRMFGSWAAGWRIDSIVLHFVNAVLVYAVASRWMFGRLRLHGSALLPAALFAAFPFAGETTIWLSARSDLLATLFSLLFLSTLDGGPRVAGLERQALRVALLAAALCAKESALPLAAVAPVVDLALRATREGAPSRAQVPSYFRFVALDLAPSWIAVAAYLAWRTFLFGTPLRVYPQSTLPAGLGEYLGRLGSYGRLFEGQIGLNTPALFVTLLLLAWVVATVVMARERSRAVVGLVGACTIAALVYALSPALLSGVDPLISDGGRNFYVAWIYLALALGLAASLTRVGAAIGVLAVAWMLVAQERNLAQWQSAAAEMRKLVGAVPILGDRFESDQYALLLVPDHVGVALFARNAEGAILDWPIQRKNYLLVMAGMTEFDLPGWREHFADGSIARLKQTRDFDMARFAGVFCWSPDSASFVRVSGPGRIDDFDAWANGLYRRVAESDCMPGTLHATR